MIPFNSANHPCGVPGCTRPMHRQTGGKPDEGFCAEHLSAIWRSQAISLTYPCAPRGDPRLDVYGPIRIEPQPPPDPTPEQMEAHRKKFAEIMEEIRKHPVFVKMTERTTDAAALTDPYPTPRNAE